MDLSFDKSLSKAYKSPSQQVRVLTEFWVKSEVYCPNCGYASLEKYRNNTPVRDFACGKCGEDFELKAKKSNFGAQIADGKYRTMMERLRSSEVPNLFTLTYDSTRLSVLNLVVIPSHFFVPDIIERRKPLSIRAKQAGWVGCKILLGAIPQAGRVRMVAEGVPLEKSAVLAAWKRTLFLREQKKVEARGWTLDVMRCIEQLGLAEFTLADAYQYEDRLSKLHAHNRHVRDKIRQQLQVLRDAGYLEFIGRGRYRVV